MLRIKRGDSIAVLGAGAVSVMPFLSRAVGPSGKVYVVDSDESVVRRIATEIQNRKLRNVNELFAPGDDLRLPEKVDSILLFNAYRHIVERELFFTAIKEYLPKGGKITVIDYYKRRMKTGPPLSERISSHDVVRELARFGFRLSDRHNVMRDRYFLVFTLKPARIF